MDYFYSKGYSNLDLTRHVTGKRPNFFVMIAYRHGFSFLPFSNASKLTPLTVKTRYLVPGRSPYAFPSAPPIPSIWTSSCSSIKFNAPSPGRNAVMTFPFLMICARTHFLTALLGWRHSTPTFSRTIARAWGDPSNGSAL